MDVVKPSDLSVGFLKDFMDLPTSYLAPGAAIKFRKFWLSQLSLYLTLLITTKVRWGQESGKNRERLIPGLILKGSLKTPDKNSTT